MNVVSWLRIAERINPQHEWFQSPAVWDVCPADTQVMLVGRRTGQVVRSWNNIEDFGIRYYLVALDTGGLTVAAQYRIRGAIEQAAPRNAIAQVKPTVKFSEREKARLAEQRRIAAEAAQQEGEAE